MVRTEDRMASNFSELENFTIDEFSAWARISRATTYRAIKDRSLVAYKVRGRTIIRRSDAEKFTARARMN
ncbi:helix-turn-helix domain-containing protein [Methylobacterium sp. CM6257]